MEPNKIEQGYKSMEIEERSFFKKHINKILILSVILLIVFILVIALTVKGSYPLDYSLFKLYKDYSLEQATSYSIMDSVIALGLTNGSLAFMDYKYLTIKEVINITDGYISKTLKLGNDNLAVTSNSGELAVLDKDYKLLRKIKAHEVYISSAIQLSNSDLVTAGNDYLKIWNSTTLEVKKQFPNGVWYQDILQTKNGLLIASDWSGKLHFYNTSTYELIKTIQTVSEEKSRAIYQVVEMKNGNILSTSGNYSAIIIDKNLNIIKELIGHTETVYRVMEIDQLDQIVTFSWDGSIKIWDTKNEYELINTYKYANHSISTVSKLQGDKIGIAADGTFYVVDPFNGYKNIITLTPEPKSAIEVAIQVDNGNIILSNRLNNLTIWG